MDRRLSSRRRIERAAAVMKFAFALNPKEKNSPDIELDTESTDK
jgi:hypothetical protein